MISLFFGTSVLHLIINTFKQIHPFKEGLTKEKLCIEGLDCIIFWKCGHFESYVDSSLLSFIFSDYTQ